MKNTFILFAILLGLSHNVCAQPTFNAEQSLQELTADKGNIGISAGYSVDGELKWSNSAGLACLDAKTPFSTTTLTRIASISKSMTAIAIMQLVEQNLIELDESIQTYLPEFPKKDKDDITIRQLLTHTSGVSQYEGKREVENYTYYPSLQDAINLFADRPLLFEPGTEFFYTTYGNVILGRILEEVSGMSFEKYMQKNIWDVAEMNNTGVEHLDRKYENKSCLYHITRALTRTGHALAFLPVIS